MRLDTERVNTHPKKAVSILGGRMAVIPVGAILRHREVIRE
jgi:hypothetical protein